MLKISIKLMILLIAIAIIALVYFWNFSPKEMAWGVTFSKKYAQYELGLDWKKTYLAILDDLKVDHIRLLAYWDEIEPDAGKYNFTDLDWQINEASKRDVKIILAAGRRLPRWPECHDPIWIKDQSPNIIADNQLKYITETIKRYDSNKGIIYWQIENEPYLKYFGICPPLDKEFFKKEIALAKSLTVKPILVTDSGELGLWIPASRSGGDILGTTLYRVVYNKTFGYVKYFLPPSFYFAKSLMVKIFSPVERIIVAELQAEAWHKENENLKQMTLDEGFQSMSLKQFKNNIDFSKKAGFDEVYLWGVEWWYLAKENKAYGSYWNEAKKLWQ